MSKVREAVWHFCGTDGWCYVDWADHWQTMITGCLAVGAAALAASLARDQLRVGREQVSTAREQIQAQLDDQADQRLRKLRAARATLPGVLSEICQHAGDVAKSLADLWPVSQSQYPDDFNYDAPQSFYWEAPMFPPELVSPLQEVLINLDDNVLHERIASIFREAQVLDARTRPLGNAQNMTVDWLTRMVLEAVALYVRAESLFEFARGESDTVEQDLWPRMFIALGILNIRNPYIKKQAELERSSGMMPGEGDLLPPPKED